MSSYEPYQPEKASGFDAEAADDRPAGSPTYETYDAQPSAAQVVQAGTSTSHPTAPPMIYRSRSTGAGAVIGGVVAVVVIVLVLVGASRSASGPSPADQRDTYAQCAAEHDEDASLFSDEGWCDLELEGGNGNGLSDEGGDGGPVDENSIFGDDGDPFGNP